MSENKKTNRNVVILAVCLAFILVITLSVQLVMIGVETMRNKEYKQQIDSLNEQIAKLKNDIEYRQTLQYVEKYAREELDLFGQDDVIFIPEE